MSRQKRKTDLRILAFDTARITGWAFGGVTGPRQFGSFQMPQTYEAVAPYLDYFARRAEDLVERFEPTLIAFEAPLLRMRDNPAKLAKLYGLCNAVEMAAWQHGIPYEQASLSEIRTHFLGKGWPRDSKRLKILVKVKCRELGWEVTDDNQADALALLDYMLALERPASAVASTPLFAKKRTRRAA